MGGNEGFRFARLAEFRHQQENPRQALFAGVEELIDKIGLGSHAAGQQKLEEYVGECRLVMHHSDHFVSADLERCAGVHGSRGRHVQPDNCGERLLPNKIARGEKGDCGFFPVCETTVTLARPFCR